MGVRATRFGIRRTLLSMGDGGTIESIVVFEMEGECMHIAKTWSEGESSDIRLVTGLFAREWYFIMGNLVLNRFTTLADAVTSFRQM